MLQLISDPSVLAPSAKKAVEAIRTGTVTTGVNAMAPERNDNALNNQPARRIELTGMANR